ncbi:MAG: nitrile hydratase subunit beta [Ectothiorhodospiraceae bacterium]|nr:nitrile hydratase subunit beta [Ectothiorhodospiraceae bacterium]
MNGIHDMGGMHGFGPVPIEENEPLFHADWEARAMALTVVMASWKRWNIDASRYARERIPPREYLNSTYYERWIHALTDQMLEAGLITEQELRTGEPVGGPPNGKAPLDPDGARAMLRRGGPSRRQVDAPPRFRPGDAVRTGNRHPEHHTRLPRYARGKLGEVVLHHGAHVLPDTNAIFQGEQPEHLYAVRFAARELWGPDASPRDTVTLDLWESYLEAR